MAQKLRITLRRKRAEASNVDNVDANRRHKIKIRMSKVSSIVRKAELAVAPKSTEIFAQKSTELTPAENAARVEKLERIKRARTFSGKHMPVLNCNSCAMSRSCPKYRAGFECAFLPFLNSHKVDSPEDLVHYMKELCGANMRRAHFMTMLETANGGMPSLETSEALGLAFQQLKQLKDVMDTSPDISVSVETDDASIIGQLFGGLKSIVSETVAMKEQQAELAAAIPVSTLSEETRPVGEDVVDELIKEHALTDNELPAITVDVAAHPVMRQAAPGNNMPVIEVTE